MLGGTYLINICCNIYSYYLRIILYAGVNSICYRILRVIRCQLAELRSLRGCGLRSGQAQGRWIAFLTFCKYNNIYCEYGILLYCA